MRETLISNCEKAFINKIISAGSRLDGRRYNESRKLSLSFGSEWGSVMVSLGETKILAQVTCEVVQPKMVRPNEGLLFINVELSPMASPQFESNRQTDLTVYLNRLLEKCYKDSKCVDLESLCIVVEEKVWSLRVDLRVLNHSGNLLECCSIASLAALAHFKRPDITRSGETVIIHTVAEKDPIPTVLYHYPVCVVFAIMPNEVIIADPNFLEESVCTGSTEEGMNTAGGLLVIGMNQYREVCLMDLSGAAISNCNLVYKAIQQAANRCKDYVDLIKQAIIDDDNLRKKRTKINFNSNITTDHKMSLASKDLNIRLAKYNFEDESNDMEVVENSDVDEDISLSKYNVKASKPNTAMVTQDNAKSSSWVEVSSDSD